MNEKYIKEKLNLINNRLNKIEEMKDNMNQNIKSSEFELISFYDESKTILQKMKLYYKYGKIYKEKEYQNLEELNIIKNKYNILLKENNRLKVNLKINNSFQSPIQMNNNGKNISKNKDNKLNLSNLNPKRNFSCSKSCSQKHECIIFKEKESSKNKYSFSKKRELK